MVRSLGRRAFTLVELLVVIAIIGILVALLLPAVQKIRSAAARSQCANNLKQIGLAIHHFHDARKMVPAGGHADSPPYGTSTNTGGNMGSAWTVFLLPYLDQKPLYDKFKFIHNSGWAPATSYYTAHNVTLPVYRCPTTTLPLTGDNMPSNYTDPEGIGPPIPGSVAIMVQTYAGIAGAVNGLIPGYTETRINDGACSSLPGCSNGGIASGGGTLIHGGRLKFKAFSDGLSNTLAIAEQSDVLTLSNGVKAGWNCSSRHGWLIGSRWTNPPPSIGNGRNIRHFQCTTIRYRINQTTGWDPGAENSSPAGWSGNCTVTGVCQDNGNNIPLSSTHFGGVNGLLLDGSVRFINDTLDIAILAQLATRDDGIPIPEW